MKYALSTNWNNRRLDDGAAIADEALALGFDALELGFNTTAEQLPGFKSRLNQIPVESVHAYVPVPVGAPSGHPELYRLNDRYDDGRAMARLHIRKSLAVATDLGAVTVVYHAGYADMRPRLGDLFACPSVRRRRRTALLEDVISRELDAILPDFEKAGVTLAFENLPRLEGYPSTEEGERLMKRFAGSPLALWFDTGHARVRECNLWDVPLAQAAKQLMPFIRGIHLNDVTDVNDDHYQPGGGKVDFASLREVASKVRHLVFEPSSGVSRAKLEASLPYVKALWEK